MNWFGKFMIFLAIAVVAVTCGMTVYYLARVNEVITFDQGVVNTNKGEQFSVTVTREDAQADTKIEMIIGDADVLKLNNTENKKDGSVVFTFDAINGGSTTLTLNTSKEEYNHQNCTVYVGDGTEANPYYITSGEDMDKIGTGDYTLDANYKMVNDIDLGMYKRWEPIANGSRFEGTFDGAGYTIYNLTIKDYELDEYGRPAKGFPELNFDMTYAGLFAELGISSVVKNVNLSQASVIPTDVKYMGVLAGVNKGTVEMVNVTESVIGNEHAEIGGIVSCNLRRMSRVSFDGTINAGKYAGGIAATNLDTIINAYSKGIMIPQTEETIMGGIAGFVQYFGSCKGYIINTYSVMTVAEQEDGTYLSDKMGMIAYKNMNIDGSNDINDLIGKNRIYGNYYATTQGFSGIYGMEDNKQRYFTTAVTLEQMKNAPSEEVVAEAVRSQSAIITETDVVTSASYITYYANSEPASWDFERVWMIDANINGGLPVLRGINDNAQAVADMIYDIDPSAQVVITNETQLRNIATNLNGNYLINADITLTKPWTPIGTDENPFNGKIAVASNGERNYVISNVLIEELVDNTGFFGVLGKDAQIVGLTLNNVNIINGIWTRTSGSIAGKNYGLIQACAVLGTSEIVVYDCGSIGGIVGENYATINDVESTMCIDINTGTTVYSGGVAGWNEGSIDGAKHFGTILVKPYYISTIQYAGGIAGLTKGRITNAYAFSNIDLGNANSNTSAGGIAAYLTNSGTITNSGAVVNINAYNAGGVIGRINAEQSNAVIMSSCYSTGKLAGTNVAGIVAEFNQGIVADVYTTANLFGSNMSGLVHKFDKNATIKTSFVNVTFEGDGHKHLDTHTDYLDSDADIWNKIGRFFRSWVQDDYNKVIMDKRCGGIMTNCVFNTSNGGELQKEKQGGLVGFFKGEVLIKSTSKALTIEQCADASNFTSKGFSTQVWVFGYDYPMLNIVNYIISDYE